MNSTLSESSTDFDGPASYRILVTGRLDRNWQDRISGLVMTIHEGQGQSVRTELTGDFADQAALMGLLGQLYARGIAILEIERLGAGPNE